MLKARNIRALVTINPISFFYSHGRPNGKLYEELEQLQRVVNKEFKTGNLKVRTSLAIFTFAPTSQDLPFRRA